MRCGVGVWGNIIIITYGEIAGKCKEYYEGKYGKEGTRRVGCNSDYFLNEHGND